MFKLYKEEIELGGKKLVLETGKIARAADDAIIDNTSDSFSLS
jgi:polyribonucleotide nucleotidyltransferase